MFIFTVNDKKYYTQWYYEKDNPMMSSNFLEDFKSTEVKNINDFSIITEVDCYIYDSFENVKTKQFISESHIRKHYLDKSNKPVARKIAFYKAVKQLFPDNKNIRTEVWKQYLTSIRYK